LFVIVGLIVMLSFWSRHLLDGFFNCPAPAAGAAIHLSLVGAAVGALGSAGAVLLLRRRGKYADD
jgi:hypothetical protein